MNHQSTSDSTPIDVLIVRNYRARRAAPWLHFAIGMIVGTEIFGGATLGLLAVDAARLPIHSMWIAAAWTLGCGIASGWICQRFLGVRTASPDLPMEVWFPGQKPGSFSPSVTAAFRSRHVRRV